MLEAIKFQFYLLFHPFDGFYTMKFEKRGKHYITILNLFLFWVSYSFMDTYVSFTVAVKRPAYERNSLMNMVGILAIYLLWCVGNWAITTLMDGEGKFAEVCMATSYALLPMLIFFIPATLLSTVLANTEAAFYTMLVGISIVWFVILLFIGILTVHNYTVFKTIATIFLTFISMMIIMFLILLVVTLVSQLWTFARSVYVELTF